MSQEILQKESNGYIALYDIRGIQDFIFRTNKLKDIIGASHLIRYIFENGLEEVCDKLGYEQQTIDLKCDNEFTQTKEIEAVYIGGGNALVHFKDKAIAKAISSTLSTYVLKHTYSLSLAIAIVPTTGDYLKDFQNVQIKMQKNKAMMPPCKPLGALPLVKTEDSTGLPEFARKNENNMFEIKNMSRETYLKLLAYEDYLEKLEKELKANILDEMVEKGIDSTIAVVHIDGNSLGDKFREAIGKLKDQTYAEKVDVVRRLTTTIDKKYQSAFETIEKKLENAEKSKPLIRKVVAAGDDITFIINAKYAFDAVELFLIEIEKGDSTEDGEDVTFDMTACAGIVFCHSHYPFSNAYRVAEELCSNAKSVAKSSAYKIENKVRSWVDFQILTHMNAVNLDDYRERQFSYKSVDDTYNLLRRPYVLTNDNDNDDFKKRSYQSFIKVLKALNESSNTNNNHQLARSDLKAYRNAYFKGLNDLNYLKSRFDSRGKAHINNIFDTSDKPFFDNNNIAYFYDALEMFDDYKPLN